MVQKIWRLKIWKNKIWKGKLILFKLIKKHSEQLIKNIEKNQTVAVEELEQLYEKKLFIENEKYLKLETMVKEKEQIFQKIM
jgi:hypothetical protein